jgi:hypothetical protein
LAAQVCAARGIVSFVTRQRDGPRAFLGVCVERAQRGAWLSMVARRMRFEAALGAEGQRYPTGCAAIKAYAALNNRPGNTP